MLQKVHGFVIPLVESCFVRYFLKSPGAQFVEVLLVGLEIQTLIVKRKGYLVIAGGAPATDIPYGNVLFLYQLMDVVAHRTGKAATQFLINIPLQQTRPAAKIISSPATIHIGDDFIYDILMGPLTMNDDFILLFAQVIRSDVMFYWQKVVFRLQGVRGLGYRR